MARKAIVAVVLSVVAFLVIVVLISALTNTEDEKETPSRTDLIPTDAVKGVPSNDLHPPVLHSNEWLTPIPMPGPVNTAGAEDSPFITPDGEWFFFFFTPDVAVPPQDQLLDGVTGIWWTQRDGSTWTEPERVLLNNDVALDGAEFVQDDVMWFASVREGNYGEIDIYTARYDDGRWTGVQNAGEELNSVLDVGEFHVTLDGLAMYYGGQGETAQDTDIWIAHKVAGEWGRASRVPNVNSELNENQPFLTPDDEELWFTGQSRLGYTGPAVFRSVWNGLEWSEPEEIVSRFAGEPTMDRDGNLYFVHHFFDASMNMVEADIYVAYRNAASARAADVFGTTNSEPPNWSLQPVLLGQLVLVVLGVVVQLRPALAASLLVGPVDLVARGAPSRPCRGPPQGREPLGVGPHQGREEVVPWPVLVLLVWHLPSAVDVAHRSWK